jgi:hypothetical protein
VNKLFPILFYLVLVFSFYSNPTFSQSNTNPEYLSLLDSVKTFYGDTCCIGVNSNLIKRLYNFKNYSEVKSYLDIYDSIRQKIEGFRDTYKKSIYNEAALLLDLSRIFKNAKQQNIVNVAGIYLGSDSVTSIGLSYIILRSSPVKFYSKLYQVPNIEKAFREEITNFGNDWYKSLELNNELKFPLK